MMIQVTTQTTMNEVKVERPKVLSPVFEVLKSGCFSEKFKELPRRHIRMVDRSPRLKLDLLESSSREEMLLQSPD